LGSTLIREFQVEEQLEATKRAAGDLTLAADPSLAGRLSPVLPQIIRGSMMQPRWLKDALDSIDLDLRMRIAALTDRQLREVVTEAWETVYCEKAAKFFQKMDGQERSDTRHPLPILASAMADLADGERRGIRWKRGAKRRVDRRLTTAAEYGAEQSGKLRSIDSVKRARVAS